jgi:hypothetical protein
MWVKDLDGAPIDQKGLKAWRPSRSPLILDFQIMLDFRIELSAAMRQT